MYERPDIGSNKKRSGNIFSGLVTVLMNEAARSYYLIWALIFGAGIYTGIKIILEWQFPGYVCYIVIAAMFFLLAGSLYAWIKRPINSSKEACREKIRFLVLFPAVIFFLSGILVPYAGWEETIPPGEENKADAPIIVQLEGRVSSHPEKDYGNNCFDMVIKSSSHEDLRRGDAISVIIKGPVQYDIRRDDMLRIKGSASISRNGLELEAGSQGIELAEEKRLYRKIIQSQAKVLQLY